MSNLIRLNEHTEITNKDIQNIMTGIQSTFIISDTQLISEGLSTTNYIVSIKDQDNKYLLKIYPENKKNAHIESMIMTKLSKDISIPKIHRFDDSKSIIPMSYMVMDFIKGQTLIQYVRDQKKISLEMAYQLGKTLSKMHQTKFKTIGLVDEYLTLQKEVKQISSLFEYYKKGYAVQHLKTESQLKLEAITSEYLNLIASLDQDYVFSHGDFNQSNMLVDENQTLWFIDFEYCMAAPKYLDLGKFLRKRANFSDFLTEEVMQQFRCGYESLKSNHLESNWIMKSRLTDLTSLLGLINREKTNTSWVTYIEGVINQLSDDLNSSV